MNEDPLPSTPGDFRLEASNLGPLAEAAVDLRPLTVFVGPSNTGKSYLATLLYALHRSFSERFPASPVGRDLFTRLIWGGTDLDEATSRDLRDWLSRAEAEEGAAPFPSSLESAVRRSIEQPLGLAQGLADKVRWCFGVDSLERLVRHGQRAATRVSLRIPRPSSSGNLDYRFNSHSDDISLSGRIGGQPSVFGDCTPDSLESVLKEMQNPLLSLGMVSEPGADRDLDRLLRLLTVRVRQSLLHPFQRSAYYLPADRTGVMHSHRVVVSSLIRSAGSAGLRPTDDLPLLPGVLADFLDQLLTLGRPQALFPAAAVRPSETIQPLAERFEQAVLRGAVRTDSTAANYPEFLYRPAGWRRDLPLTQASSMVSELAPIVLYLRHLVRLGDVLIIEEPEAHLHPAMQVEVTRRLAELVEAGVRIVITTHSEWVLEELANLIRLSQVDDRREPALHPDRVGVWRFHPPEEKDGARVTEIEMGDAGLFEAGYEQVAMEVHNRWADLAGSENPGISSSVVASVRL